MTRRRRLEPVARISCKRRQKKRDIYKLLSVEVGCAISVERASRSPLQNALSAQKPLQMPNTPSYIQSKTSNFNLVWGKINCGSSQGLFRLSHPPGNLWKWRRGLGRTEPVVCVCHSMKERARRGAVPRGEEA